MNDGMVMDGGDAVIYGIGPFGGLFMVLVWLLSVFAFWRIFAKAGYGGAWGFLAVFPPIQFLLLLFLALASWRVAPTERG